MKIKEVIEKTNLTDRAIRLYIDNGLVSPGIEENYSGRKNIDFSERDVERLNQIALLRKAGFSISDIKEIISDNGKIEDIVTKFIKESEEEIRNKSQVIEKLKSISFDEKISLKILCEKLSPSVEETEVPREDLDAPRSYKIAKKVMQVWAVAGLTVSVGVLLAILITTVSYYKYYRPTVMTMLLSPISFGGLICIAVLCSSVLKIFKENRKEKENRKTDAGTSVSLLIISTIIFLPSLFLSFTFGIFAGCSSTTNPKNYLEVDLHVEQDMDKILRVFPARIPSSLRSQNSVDDSVEYYYYYENNMAAEYKILTQWKLDEKDYLQAIKDAKEGKDYIVAEKGDWTLLHFAFEPQTNMSVEEYIEHNCYNLTFAYNNKTQTVRYIVSLDYSDNPYYKQLEW